MPRITKTTKTTKTTSTKRKVQVALHLPGKMPEMQKFPANTTFGDVIADRNLTDYDVTINGKKASNSQVLSEGDIIRVGIRTKNS